jgi:two-component system sensor histidine kinase QseC
MKPHTWSLRTRLTLFLCAAAIVAWVASSFWLYRNSLAETSRLFDAALVETAHAVLAVVAHEVKHFRADDEGEVEIELETVDHDHAESVFYQVRSRRGDIVYRSPGAPSEPLAAASARGFGTTSLADGDYRVYSLQAEDGQATIHVGQPVADRRLLARSTALRLLWPGLVLAVVLALGVWLIVRRVTAPVIGFAQAIDARAPGDSTPVQLQPLPAELRPVGQAVNRLFARVDDALRHERTLTADAAHELRTPLAALRAQAQVALRARDGDQRDEALRTLIAGVDRATHVVSSVMTLARLDARQLDLAALPPVALSGLAKFVLDEFVPVAQARQITLRHSGTPVLIKGDADALAVLLRNLLDNAVRHARSNVHVEVRRDGTAALLRVCDDGAGLPPGMAARVFDRFYRGSTDGSGAGLGLALVKRIVELHGGEIGAASSENGGAVFEIRLPAAKDAA